MSKKILVIDDDVSFVEMVNSALNREGFEVLTASNRRDILKTFYTLRPNMVIMDVSMPLIDGWQVCRNIREASDVPILIFTGFSRGEEDVVRGFDYGADEYVLKPISGRELIARVKAVFRRIEHLTAKEPVPADNYFDDYLVVNLEERKILVDGTRARLTPIEFRLFAQLVQNAGRILTHNQLLEKVWGWEYTNDIDYVRVYISRIRQKIEGNPSQPRYILTDPGVGYYFCKKDMAQVSNGE